MKNQSKIAGFLNGKGFYIALGICMLAIGISAWTAVGKINDEDLTAENSSESSYFSVTSDKTPVSKENEEPEESSSLEQGKKEEEPVVSKETVEPAGAPVAKYFVLPLKGEIIKKYSDSSLQYSLTYNDMRLHKGIDIKGTLGSGVTAAGDGVVLSVENEPMLGYTVKIDHGNGVMAVYSGLSSAVAVKKGDEVKEGTSLAPLGSVPCESLDAPHLHLEFYKNDKPVDPLSYITNN